MANGRENGPLAEPKIKPTSFLSPGTCLGSFVNDYFLQTQETHREYWEKTGN